LIKLNMSGYKLEKSTWDSFRREWEALYSPREMTIPKN